MIAAIVQSPDIAIDDDEAEKLAKAIANVTRHYDVPQMAQTTIDWIMLIQAGGAIYGPRLIAWRMERASQRVKPAPQNRSAPQNIAPAATAPARSSPAPSTTPMPNPFDARKQPMPSAGDPSSMQGVPLMHEPVPHAPSNNNVVAGPPRHNPALAGVDGAGLQLKIGE